MPRSEYYQKNKERCLEVQKQHYQRNKERCLTYAKAWYDSVYTENKEWAIQYLGGCCNRCKQTFPKAVYDFHHKDPSVKEASVGNLLKKKDRSKIKEELDKCELLCSNCHRIEHHEKDWD